MVRVELEMPSRSPYVGVVRLALASLARAAGLDEEVVDDLKIAVSEACANAVLASEGSPGDGLIKVTWLEQEGGVVVEVDSEDTADDSRDEQRLTMSMALLESLVGTCEIARTEQGRVVTRLVINR